MVLHLLPTQVQNQEGLFGQLKNCDELEWNGKVHMVVLHLLLHPVQNQEGLPGAGMKDFDVKWKIK